MRAKGGAYTGAGSGTQETLQLAIKHHLKGRSNKAERLYKKVLKTQPDNFEALYMMGCLYLQAGKPEPGLNYMQRAVAVNPSHAEAHSNLGIALKALGRLEEAVESYHRALALDPRSSSALYNLGIAHKALENLEVAASAFKQVLAIKPGHAAANNNLGMVLKDLGRLDEATVAFQRSLAIDPNHANAHVNLGTALQDVGKLDEALVSYRRALIIDPNHAGAHLNLSLALLLTGQFDEGWDEYEWRWEAGEIPSTKRGFPQPFWDGVSVDEKSLLVWGEQGVGDEIMFASMFPDLKERVGKLIVECEPRLKPLFERSFPNTQIVERSDPPSDKLAKGRIDCQIASGQLCRYLRPNLAAFPLRKGFLKAHPDAVRALRDKYQSIAEGRISIGISWRSGNRFYGRERTAPLDLWAPLLANENCLFINLQYGDVRRDLSDFEARTGVTILHDESVDPLASLEDFASQVAALDLVISIDNSTVHMASALGKLVWTLLPYAPDWRWMLERDDSPWYPSMRHFRQPSRGDWDSVFEDLETALRKSIPEFRRSR